MSTLATVFGYGLLSARAAASVAGRFYYATDTSIMYRDNGSSWDALAVGAGSIATDTIWAAAGDLAQGTGSHTAAVLSAPLTGKVLTGAGLTTAVAYKYPPGYEFDYVEKTTTTSITATTEGTANTIVTANAVTYDGSQIVMVEFWCPYVQPVSGVALQFTLYDGAASIGLFFENIGGTGPGTPAHHLMRRLTPSNAAHTYSVRAFTGSGTGTIGAGAGGNGLYMPAFIRQTKVSGGA